MYTYLKKQYAVLLSVICFTAIPTIAMAQGLPELPKPIELEGKVQDVQQFDCKLQHSYWCGRITGLIRINGDNGEVIARYLKRDTTMLLNGNATFFEGIKPGDKAKISYFEDEVWASALELQRKGF